MEYFSNLELVQSIARQIVQDRRCNYSEEPLHNFLEHHPEIQHKPLNIANKRNENLVSSLFRTTPHRQKPCIIYLHALGSNRLQSLHVVIQAAQHYDVMGFDFSGSGKSQGQYTTFGLWEHEDIDSIIRYLSERFKYQSYILWGRSMGAVSAAMYLSKYHNKSVKCLILDSPFSSFEKTAIELACCKSSLPEFMLNACLIPLRKCIKQNYPFDPFEIDLVTKMKQISCKIGVIYSQNDTVVHYSNSKRIIEACPRFPDIIKIEEDHNILRKPETYQQVLRIIQDAFTVAERRSRSRGIRLYSNSRDKVAEIDHRLRTEQNLMERRPNSSRRRSIFSSIQTETDSKELPRRNKKICILPTFYESELLMMNKENKRFDDNIINKIQISAIRKNRFGLK